MRLAGSKDLKASPNTAACEVLSLDFNYVEADQSRGAALAVQVHVGLSADCGIEHRTPALAGGILYH